MSVVRLEWEAAAQLVRGAQKVVIVTHVRPDGDAIGSMCALGLALREQGKTVTMVVDGGVSAYLRRIPGAADVLPKLPTKTEADLVISCDAGDLERTGKAGAAAFAFGVPTLVIDHHATNTFFGGVHLVHEDYVSTTEALLRFFDFLGWSLSQPVATALLVGFMTDTISFRVGPVVPETFEQVRRLVEAGANMREIVERFLIQLEPGILKLMGLGLANMEVEEHVAWSYLSLDSFKQLGLPTANKPELSTELLRDERAYIACFFLETEDQDIRISFRATNGFDVGKIAASLGGGGHTQAAGATLEKTTVQAAIDRVLPLLKAEAQRGTPLYKD